MNEQQYKAWWQLHRRVAVGEQLSDEERRIYQSGLAELEAEEMGTLHPADDEWQALRAQWVELAARRRELARQEEALRARAAELESQYLALTHYPIGLEI